MMIVAEDDELRILESHKTLLSSTFSSSEIPRERNKIPTNHHRPTKPSEVKFHASSSPRWYPTAPIPFAGNQTQQIPTKSNETQQNPAIPNPSTPNPGNLFLFNTRGPPNHPLHKRPNSELNPLANSEVKDLIYNEPIKNKTQKKQNQKQKQKQNKNKKALNYRYGHDSPPDQEPRPANDDFPSHPKKPRRNSKTPQKTKSQSTLLTPK